MDMDTVADRAAAPIIAKHTGVLAAADIEIFTRTTTFAWTRRAAARVTQRTPARGQCGANHGGFMTKTDATPATDAGQDEWAGR